ncbi:MAG: DMT family transporter [Chloroflexota bacterium]|nr:DMT family transporter [Chloroflexota bacterium]
MGAPGPKDDRVRPGVVMRLAPLGEKTRPVLIMVAITGISSLCFVSIKAGLPFAPPLLFAGLRTLIGGSALLGVVALRGRPVVPTRGDWPWILALAPATTTLTFGAMFLSPGRTGVGIAAVFGSLQPLLAIALAAAVLDERIAPRTGIALGLGLGGVALIAWPALTGPGAYGIEGALLALTASVGGAVGSVLIKRMGRPAAVPLVTAWQLIIGSLPLLIGSALVERDMRVVWTAKFVGLLLFLALAGTAFTTAAWYALIQGHDVGRLSLFFFMVPVFGLLAGAVFFAERIGPLDILGLGTIVAGVLVVAGAALDRSPPPQAGRSSVTEGVSSRNPVDASASYMHLFRRPSGHCRSERVDYFEKPGT